MKHGLTCLSTLLTAASLLSAPESFGMTLRCSTPPALRSYEFYAELTVSNTDDGARNVEGTICSSPSDSSCAYYPELAFVGPGEVSTTQVSLDFFGDIEGDLRATLTPASGWSGEMGLKGHPSRPVACETL